MTNVVETERETTISWWADEDTGHDLDVSEADDVAAPTQSTAGL
jgi:hypothetical protein